MGPSECGLNTRSEIQKQVQSRDMKELYPQTDSFSLRSGVYATSCAHPHVRGMSRNIPIAMDLVNFSCIDLHTFLAVCRHVVHLCWDHGTVPINALTDLFVWDDFWGSSVVWPVSAKCCCVQSNFIGILQMFGLRIVFCLVFCAVRYCIYYVQMEKKLEQRSTLKFLVAAGNTRIQCFRQMPQVYGTDSMGITQERHWHRRF